MNDVRVLITGSRKFTDRSIIANALTAVFRAHGGARLIVVHGAANGADSIAGAIARANPEHLVEERHPANWRPDPANPSKVDRAAGVKRNAAMVSLGTDVCLAFLHRDAKNIGTWHCVRTAKRAGIEVREHWQELDSQQRRA